MVRGFERAGDGSWDDLQTNPLTGNGEAAHESGTLAWADDKRSNEISSV